MKVLRRALWRLAGVLAHQREDAGLAGELENHLDLLTRENLRAGMEPAEARRQAALRFGKVSSTREACREQRGLPRLEAFLKDLRHAARALRKTPGFSLAVVLTLAVAAGANTAVFSLVNQALFHPHGIDHAERIVSIREHYGKLLNLSDLGATSGSTFADVRNSRSLFEHAAALTDDFVTYTGGSKPEHLEAERVSLEWFAVLGAKPLLGRTFAAEEDQPNAQRVVVLSYATWTKLFGADRSILGRWIELDLQPYKVIGVMKRGFDWIGPADLWTPLALSAADTGPQERFHQHLFVLGRLRPQVSQQQANTWLRLLTARVLASGVPGAKETAALDWYLFSKSFADTFAGDARTPMPLLLMAVGLVLLIATANIAGLTLARNAARSQQLAVQAALGAGRGRLLSRLAAESLLLSMLGTGVGLALAVSGMRAVLFWAPKDAVPGLDARFDVLTLGFTAAVITAAGIFFGILPAWQASATSPFAAMKAGGRTASSRQRLRSSLVVVEAALALVLMVAAGALLRSFLRLEAVPPGFDTRGVMTAAVSFPASQYANAEKEIPFYRTVLDRLPSGSAFASMIPFVGGVDAGGFDIQGRPANEGSARHSDVRFVSPGYFEGLHIPLKRGRFFGAADQAGTERVALIDENMARQFWPGEDPIGQQVRPNGAPVWFTVVGVVGHVLQTDLAVDSGRGTLYYDLFQTRRRLPAAFLVTQAPGEAIREAVGAASPVESVFDVKSLADRVAASLASRRFVLRIMCFFAATALFLAALGLYGVISYAVSQRTREIGVRMALGARVAGVSGMIVGEGLRLAAMGAGLGWAAAAGLAHLLESQLFRVRALDLATALIAAAILLAVAVAASFLPARRAASIDPIAALRCD
jgi:predicted permease